MSEFVPLDTPRFVTGKPMLIAGLSERYISMEVTGIPAQWQRFSPHLGHIADQRGSICYGVCHDFGENGQFGYLCGVEVSRANNLPSGFTLVRLTEQDYAVFTHRDHISSIGKTTRSIWQMWLPSSGYQFAEAPEFERYDDRFDPQSGQGEVEIWLPIKK